LFCINLINLIVRKILNKKGSLTY